MGKRITNHSAGEIDLLSSGFLDHIHANGHPLVTSRDALSDLFQEFVKGRNYEKTRRIESLVMTRMRQRKWIRATKRNQSNVIVVKIVMDDRKTFPTAQELKTARELLVMQQEDAERNKNGVIMRLQTPDGEEIEKTVNAPLGEGTSFIVHLEAEMPGTLTILDDIEVRGLHSHWLEPHRDALRLLGKLPMTFDLLSLRYQVKPTSNIGLLRARISLSLRDDAVGTFEISRSIAISCGDAAISEALKPKTPYKPKSRSADPKFTKVHWPEGSAGQAKSAGFKTLEKFYIPAQIKDLLRYSELKGYLDSFEWSPKSTLHTRGPFPNVDEQYKCDIRKGYGRFWSTVLYASEYQSNMDIQLFDMKGVTLQKTSNSMFTLEVPGLAEGRPSVLRGDIVNLTWNGNLWKGRVHDTKHLKVILQFPQGFTKSFSPSLDRVELVRFTFSRTTFRTSHQACMTWAQKHLGPTVLEPTKEIAERCVYMKREATTAVKSSLSFTNRNLNPEQQTAIHEIVEHKRGLCLPYILFGPPGTGKTTVVVETVYQLAIQHRRGGPKCKILLTAPSNDAADILVERLSQYFPPKELLRVLAYSRKPENLIHSIRPYASQGEDPAIQLEEMMTAKIVVATVNMAARFFYMGVPCGHFDVICVDEAGHATEPETVGVAATLMNVTEYDTQLILAGDPKQLGPVTTSRICELYGIGVSLLERLSQRPAYQRNPETANYPPELLTKLVRNYRSHPALLKLPNEMFYDGELLNCADMMVTHSLMKWECLPKPGFPILFHSIKGENLREGNSPSWFNPEEAQQVAFYVSKLLKDTKPSLRDDEIGIITPYARQAQKIRQALQLVHPKNEIKVGSVECFQGQERRVIILSTVRSEPELYLDHDVRYNLGFVAHPKRFNVAMTRAKALLIVVGCPSVLCLDKDNWLPFLNYCRNNGAWTGEAWEPTSSDEDGGDEIVFEEDARSRSSWEMVQATENFAFINREE